MKGGCRLVAAVFFIGFLAPGGTSYGATVEDVRDITGVGRLSEVYSEQEKEEIRKQYRLIKTYNLYADMFERMNELDINTEVEQLESVLAEKREEKTHELESAFKGGEDVDSILELLSERNVLDYEIDKLRELRVDIVLERKGEDIEKKYWDILRIDEQLVENREIGSVGKSLLSPLHSGFILERPYTEGNGVRLKGVRADKVKVLWGGTVVKVEHGKISVEHGGGLQSEYGGLDRIGVLVGDTVKQHGVIGEIDNILDLRVWVDGKEVNPLYVFGNKGLKAYQQYVSYNPAWNRDMKEMEKEIERYERKTEKQEKEKETVESKDSGVSSFSYETPIYSREELLEIEKSKEAEDEKKD